MQIEAGKFYKTRDGRKAFVAAILPENPFTQKPVTYPVRGFAQDEGACCWNDVGHFYSANDLSKHDLVAEWTDPPTPLQVCQKIVELVGEPDAKISWPYMATIVQMATEAVKANK